MTVTSRRGVTEVIGAYQDDARVRWQVGVRRLAAERWEVYEVGEHQERRVIDELSGEGESEGSALALAHDFLEQQRRRFAR